jgi:hypothetical protein
MNEILDVINQKRRAVLERWFDLVVDTYASDASRFMKTVENEIANPVGRTYRREMEALFDGLMRGAADDEISQAIEGIVKIRAVQDFAPSEGVAFVFLLKRALGETLGLASLGAGHLRGMRELEARIDRVALLAFDIYEGCMRRIYDIRVNEFKRANYMLLRRAALQP